MPFIRAAPASDSFSLLIVILSSVSALQAALDCKACVSGGSTMMLLMVSPLYLVFSALLLVLLSIRIILLRRTFKAGLGDKNEPSLKKAIRAHGNFTEYVPLALLMLVVMELMGVAALYLHLVGGSLLLGRVIHAWGVSQLAERLIWRLCGMLLTFFSLLVSALVLVLYWLRLL
jgi:uncharacterized protein